MSKWPSARVSQLVVYVLLVAVVVTGFISLQNTASARKADRVKTTNELCVQSQITRQGLRDQVTSVAVLGRSLITPDNPNKAALDQQFTDFENSQLAKLPPLKCPVASASP